MNTIKAMAVGLLAAASLYTPVMAQSEAETERMMALALYHEARGKGADAQIAVGWAILNRVEDPTYPGSIVGVITQGGETPPCQFGWWCDGKSDEPTEADTWQEAQDLARKLLSAEPPADPTNGAIFFWESWRDTPSWAEGKIEQTAEIGGNSFFKLK